MLLTGHIVIARKVRTTIFSDYHTVGKNDAKILSEILANDSDLTNLIRPGDLFLLDRGFRDCVDELKQTYSLDSQMPSLLQNQKNTNTQDGKKKTNQQMSTLEANRTRFVTKCRWVVEVINAFLKNSFKAIGEDTLTICLFIRYMITK